jgi:spermidine/putrescine-binding protein
MSGHVNRINGRYSSSGQTLRRKPSLIMQNAIGHGPCGAVPRTLAIPADAPHPDEAHAFIDFLMRADVAARNANYVGQATINAAALPMIDTVLRNDPSIYPPAEVLARLFPLRARTQEETRLESSAWTSFRSGQ